MKVKNIQALRAIAAVLVVIDHIPRDEAKLFPSGYLRGLGVSGAIGVDLFFVISGFIMLVTTWGSFGMPGAPLSFLIRRILRIYPIWILAVVIGLGVNAADPRLLHVDDRSWPAVVSTVLLVNAGYPLVLFIGWSLQYEMYFYVAFAFMLAFERRRLGLLVGAWVVLTLALNASSGPLHLWFLAFVGSPLNFEFIAGMLIGWLFIRERMPAASLFLVAGALGAAAVFAYATHLDGLSTWFRALTAGPSMACVVYGAVGLERQNRLIAHRSLVKLGDASYSMYVWHGYILGVFVAFVGRLHLRGRIWDAAFDVGALAMAIFGAIALYRLIERPLLRSLSGLGRLAPERNIVRTSE